MLGSNHKFHLWKHVPACDWEEAGSPGQKGHGQGLMESRVVPVRAERQQPRGQCQAGVTAASDFWDAHRDMR